MDDTHSGVDSPPPIQRPMQEVASVAERLSRLELFLQRLLSRVAALESANGQ